MTAASGPEVCACNGWVTDLRVGYPHGHHPRCPEQPHPSRPVELLVDTSLITDTIMKLPGAVLLNAKLDTTPFLEPGRVKLLTDNKIVFAVAKNSVISVRRTDTPPTTAFGPLIQNGIITPSEVKPWSEGDLGGTQVSL